MTDDEDELPDAATKPDTPPKRTPQLVMTPQLQQAIRLLSTPTAELHGVIAEWQAAHPGAVAALAPGEPDPDDEREREEAEEAVADGYTPFFYYEEEPLPPLGADVLVFGNPPQARANGRALPRLRTVFDDAAMTRSAIDVREASWLVRSLRQRARSYEKIVAVVLELRPQLAIAPEPSEVEPVSIDAVAEAVGMHESTVRRIAGACRFQTLHGLMRFTHQGKRLGFARA